MRMAETNSEKTRKIHVIRQTHQAGTGQPWTGGADVWVRGAWLRTAHVV